jgi:hypothetical protein
MKSKIEKQQAVLEAYKKELKVADPKIDEFRILTLKTFIKKLEKDIADEKALLDDEKKIEEAAEEVIEAAEKKEEEKAEKKEKVEKTEKKYPNRGKNTVQAKAKEIRKEGEDWKSALQRAQQLMKNDKQKATKKAEKTPDKKSNKETDKLLALVRTRKELNKMVNYSRERLNRDATRKALPPGRRVSKNGNVYYTSNPAKSDMYAPGYKGKVFLSKGGAVTNERTHVNKNEKYEMQYAKNKLHRIGYLGKRHFDEGGSLGDDDDYNPLPEKNRRKENYNKKYKIIYQFQYVQKKYIDDDDLTGDEEYDENGKIEASYKDYWYEYKDFKDALITYKASSISYHGEEKNILMLVVDENGTIVASDILLNEYI